jgi:hypothetical protein
MRTLLILNDPAYGTERSYHGLRLAGALAKRNRAGYGCFLSVTRSLVPWPTRRCLRGATTSTA